MDHVISEEEAREIAEKMWQIIEDSSRYSFNSAHAISVSYDSLYNAYQKVEYTFEFFSVYLEKYAGINDKKRDIKKVSQLKTEAKSYFGIDIPDLKYGQDNTDFVIDKKNNMITQSLRSVKGINNEVAAIITSIKDDYDDFIKLITFLYEKKGVTKTHIETLIKINYFSMFGSRKKLLTYYTLYNNILHKKSFRISTLEKEKKDMDKNTFELVEKYIIKNCGSKTALTYGKINTENLCADVFSSIPDDEFEDTELALMEIDLLEEIITPIKTSIVEVLGISQKNKSIMVRSLKTNEEKWFQCKKISALKKGDIIAIKQISKVSRGISIDEYQKIEK